MTERLANEAASTLAAGIDADDLTLTVASAAEFPGAGNFRIRIDDELLLVTGVTGAVFTVTRGVESTTAAVHASAAAVTHVLTAAALTQFVTENAPTGEVTQAELDTEAATRAAADVALDTRVDALEVAPPAHTHDDRYYTESEVDTFIAGRQPVDSDLTAIAALSTTSFGRALLELANAAAGRTAFGLGTAATSATGDFDAAGAAAAAQAASQPLDSDLTAIAALSTTSFGRSLLALADAPALLSAAGAQAFDSDLTAIAAIAPTNDDLIQRKAGAWTNRTPAQVKTDLVLVKGDVGLGNVDNTADTAKPVSTAQQTALDLKANLASPTFTGTPAVPTASQGTNTTQAASTAYVQTEAGLVVSKSLVDAKGDLLVGTADNTVARKAVGSDGKFLKADSAQSDGLAWGDPPGPWLLDFDPFTATKVGTWVAANAGSQFYMTYTENSSQALNDSLAWKLWVPAGTWTFTILTLTNPDCPIITADFDGTSAGTLDLYAASLNWSQIKSITGIVLGALPSAGYRVFTIKATSKNASATAYKFRITRVMLTRTA